MNILVQFIYFRSLIKQTSILEKKLKKFMQTIMFTEINLLSNN